MQSNGNRIWRKVHIVVAFNVYTHEKSRDNDMILTAPA